MQQHAWPLTARAQQPARVPRIGVLWHAGSAEQEGTNYKAVVKGFADIGYIDGKTVVLEHRFPNEQAAQFRSMAAELVASGVDVLVAIGANAPPYAKEATKTIPVVFAIVPDPIGSKLVNNLARPEANVTGLSNSASDIVGKRLALFKEIIPGLSRVALLVNSNSSLAAGYEQVFQAAADEPWAFRKGVHMARAGRTNFSLLRNEGCRHPSGDVQPGWLDFSNRDLIAKLALAKGLPLSTYSRQTFNAGALMSYGVDHDAICYRVAVYVDKLLKGAKPSELPVEQPTKFEFLINLNTARALGLTVPPSMLLRADEVIELGGMSPIGT